MLVLGLVLVSTSSNTKPITYPPEHAYCIPITRQGEGVLLQGFRAADLADGSGAERARTGRHQQGVRCRRQCYTHLSQ